MFIDVIIKSHLKKSAGWLTYQAAQAKIGQLATVKLRGRSVTGIVVNVKEKISSNIKIKPASSLSKQTLPPSFLTTITNLADYYLLPPSSILSLIAPGLNSSFTKNFNFSATSGKQEVFLAPSRFSSIFQSLDTALSIPKRESDRQKLWLTAAAGSTLKVKGTQTALLLPFKNLDSITLDLPTSSTFKETRAPGFQTAVLASLVATSTKSKLILRSPLPLGWLSTRFPLPKQTKLISPKLNKIGLLPPASALINKNLIAHLKASLREQQRILVYFNQLPAISKISGKIVGVEQLQAEIAKQLGEPVGLLTAKKVARSERVVVATAAAIYQAGNDFNQTVILNLDQLTSYNQPWSMLSAIETIALFASRHPVFIQAKDVDHPLVTLLRQQLSPTAFAQLPIPKFSYRIIRFNYRGSQANTEWLKPALSLLDQTQQYQQDEQFNMIGLWNKQHPTKLKELILQAPKGWHVFTDEESLLPQQTAASLTSGKK